MLFKTELPVRSFDVAPDGRRFLLSLPAATPPPPATIVVNWSPLTRRPAERGDRPD
jgi:hypothetical protein